MGEYDDKMIKISVATNIDRLRVDKAMTVSQFARDLGYDENNLRQFLKTDNPHLSHVFELSVKLGVSVAYLISSEKIGKKRHLDKDEGGNPLKPNFAARVNLLFKEKGLRKVHVSKRMSITPGWWQPILIKNSPSMKTLGRVAYGMEVDPVDLVVPVTHEIYGGAMIPVVNW